MLHGGNHTYGDPPFTYSVSQRDGGWNEKSKMLTFLAQASLFFLLLSFPSGFFAAIRPWRLDSRSLLWTVDVEMCLLLELCEAFIWTTIWGAVHSNELILCSKGNSGSFLPVAVLMRASFIIVLDGFWDFTWRNFQSYWNVDWPSCLKVMMACHFSLLIWDVFAIIGLSSVYHPYLVTIQLIG